jgi:hypothetical protein
MTSRYKGIKVNGLRIDEHRWMMQNHLGRKLDTKEVVHHKNEEKKDNRLDNFEVQSLSEHSSHHMKKHMNRPEIKRKYSRLAKKQGFSYSNGKGHIKFKDGQYWCNKCNQYLPKNMFWKNKTRRYGIHGFCKNCHPNR